MKLKGHKRIKGIIEVVTGLHIGGSTNTIEIGGKDNPVIKHPITKEPYIPGSSLKGKMRSLLEWKLGKVETNPESKDFGEVHKCSEPDCPICRLFGTTAEDSRVGPTRLIFRDAVLSEKYKEEIKQKIETWSPENISEEKYENAINRITARANPRNFERVPSGVEFSFEIAYRMFEDGGSGTTGKTLFKTTDDDLFEYVIEGLKLIQGDALGGAGSRGCGQVKFWIENKEGELKSLEEISPADFEVEEGE